MHFVDVCSPTIKMMMVWLAIVLSATPKNCDALMHCPKMCQCSLVAADCSRNQWQVLPASLDIETEQLDLAHNDFTSMPSNISAFARLERLSLRRNRISALGKGALRGLMRLRELDLSANCIKTASDLHPQLLLAAGAIKVLDLSDNPLKRCPRLHSASLEVLRLNNCSMPSMSELTLESLTVVREVHVSHNQFQILALPASRSLLVLNLTWCDFQSIRLPSMQSVPLLERLLLAGNLKLKALHANSSSLLSLDVSDCNLESPPICNMSTLHDLDLSGNHIRRVDEQSFVGMRNLQRLRLSRNSILEMSRTAFSNLSQLRALDISYNPIQHLDARIFEQNPMLTILSLARSYLIEVPAFRSRSLIALDLSYSEIVRIDRDCLLGMTSLRTLRLSGNQFTALPTNFSSNSLRELDVSNGRLTTLRNTSTSRLPNLHLLDISGNRLVELQVKHFQSVRQIRLADNPWRCQCDRKSFEAMYKYLLNIDSDVAVTRCQSPEAVEGRTWSAACRQVWYQTDYTRDEKVWLVSVCLLLILLLGCCFFVTVNRERRKRNARRRDAERQVEARERLVQLVHRAALQPDEEDVEVQNAPDPRELQRPPSYTEAIAMPPLGSNLSLASRKCTSNNNVVSKSKRRSHRRKSPRTRRKSHLMMVTQSNPDLLAQQRTYPKSPRRRRRRSCDRVDDFSSGEAHESHTETDV